MSEPKKEGRAAGRPPLRHTQKRSRASKAKGRRLQQFVRDALLNIDPLGEYRSREMGQAGSDIIDPHNRLPVRYVECKNWESYPSMGAIEKAMLKKDEEGRWAAILKEPRKDPLVVVPWHTFMWFIATALRAHNEHGSPVSAIGFQFVNSED